MLFNSIQYVLFLPAVVGLYWALPKRARNFALLLASYFFYMSWLPAYGLLLGGLTLWNYVFGLLLNRRNLSGENKRLIFIAAIAGNVGCLSVFKYTNFISDTVFHLSRWCCAILHLPVSQSATPLLFQIALPLGISFFVFEFIHYLTDVYKGSEAIVNPIHFALFAAFFPSQIAGPIKRFQDFESQVLAQHSFDSARFKAGLLLVLQGMFKKVVLGDNLAEISQRGFAAAAHLACADAWIAALAFSIQIYYDFSGYTDIGRGSAMLLGYELPENFNLPYLARNLSDFWRRWHITLSSWLRDYLYIPLGGSRCSGWRQTRNLIVTMFIAGLWHGAAWHYVVFGAYHGVGLALTHVSQKLASKVRLLQAMCDTAVWDLSARVLTFVIVMIGFVVFRADDIGQALAVYRAMSGLNGQADTSIALASAVCDSLVPVGFLAYGVFLLLKFKVKLVAPEAVAGWRFWLTPPLSARVMAFAAIAVLIVCLAPRKAIPFIYFQF